MGRTSWLHLQWIGAYFGRIPAQKMLFLICLLALPIHSGETETIQQSLFPLWLWQLWKQHLNRRQLCWWDTQINSQVWFWRGNSSDPDLELDCFDFRINGKGRNRESGKKATREEPHYFSWLKITFRIKEETKMCKKKAGCIEVCN